MTFNEVLAKAQARWSTEPAKQALLEKYKCTPRYIYQILGGNKRMPGWMLTELGVEKVKVVEYRRRG